MLKALLTSLLLACSLQVNAQDVTPSKVSLAYGKAKTCLAMAFLLEDEKTQNVQANKVAVFAEIYGQSDSAIRLAIKDRQKGQFKMTIRQYIKGCKSKE